MIVYTFLGGTEIVKIRGKPIKDLEISNKKTGFKFAPFSSLLSKEKVEELNKKLASIYDEYLIHEFGIMGYKLVNKEN